MHYIDAELENLRVRLSTLERQIEDGHSEEAQCQGTPHEMTDKLVSHESAHNRIRRQIGRLRTKAECLEALLRAMPAVLPDDADQALWEMADREAE